MVAERKDENREVPKEKVWINAVAIVNPSDETLRGIGREVLRLLNRDSYPWKATIEFTAS